MQLFIQFLNTVHRSLFSEKSFTSAKVKPVNCNHILGKVADQNCIAKFHMR